jgi:cobyrinic acid a,c-diamide synthase
MQGIVIAGTHSGCGKTTVTLGILAALRKKGLTAQPFKAGPDFIDAGLHKLVADRPSRNLDLWMCGTKYVQECFLKASAGVDVTVVEGVMGMHDGEFSTARLAAVLNLPIVLVVDAYGMAESAGAVVKGFAEFGVRSSKSGVNDEHLKIAGVIFNRVASENHYKRLKESVRDVPVLGYLSRELNFEIPHRHLGLSVAEESPITSQNIDRLADAVLRHIDVDMLYKSTNRSCITQAQKQRPSKDKSAICNLQSAIRIAVAYDKAFCFYYEDNLDLLRDAGAEIIRFSPLEDAKIPDNTDALYIGGGYPELYAEQLSKNNNMRNSLRDWAEAGRPVYAECGGLMYLSKGIHDFEGNYFTMAGVLPFETRMKKGRSRLGYRELVLQENCILGNKGEHAKGHEFHYSEIDNGPWEADAIRTIYALHDNNGCPVHDEGYRYKNLLASYVHVHFGGNVALAKNFVNFVKENAWKK